VAHTTPPAGPVVAGPRLLVAEGRGSGGGRGGGQRERISSLDFIALSGGREPRSGVRMWLAGQLVSRRRLGES